MSPLKRIGEEWLRPFLFFGNNPISLIGGALTSASAMTLIGFWIVDILGHGGTTNPYVGIILDLCLPAVFLFGLFLIPVGILQRRAHLKATGQVPSIFPEVNFRDPVFRHGIDFVILATFVNFVIVGTSSYRGVAYMDQPNFCGQACHVMAPEWSAYHVSGHSSVACTECHIEPGVGGFIHAKANGTKQLFMVVLHNYPTPIMAGNKVPPARTTCLNCHAADRMIGDRLVVKTKYGDDATNAVTRTMVLVHVGGRNAAGQLSGIHGAHMGQIEFVSSSDDRQTINWVSKRNADGSSTEFSTTPGVAAPSGTRHAMDCIDCHNRPAHAFESAQVALDRSMAVGTPSASLPFVHKQGLALMEASYVSQDEATAKITAGLEAFYRTQYPDIWNGQRATVEQAAKKLTAIYDQNVFPFMKVTWGTHPNNIGHTAELTGGCFRCHDGNHTAKAGKSITNDCAVCHNLVAVDEVNPKQLAEVGIQ